MRKHIEEFDFIRVIAMVGIIIGHFSGELYNYNINSPIHLLYSYPNGGFGWLFVTIFFILSGCVLRLAYDTLSTKDIFVFYKKRWLSIFPAFYICWFFLYINNASVYGSLFYKGNPQNIILTLLGMDGYLSYRVDNYALIGEWFLGVIIILYFIYPIVNFFYNQNKWLVGCAIIVSLAMEIRFGIAISTGPFRNISSSLLSFYFGMLYIDYREMLNKQQKIFFPIALIISATLLTCGNYIPFDAIWQVHILGITVFLVFVFWGGGVMKCFKFNKTFSYLSKLSYCMFLVQHVIINEILNIFRGRTISGSVYLIILIFTIIWIIIIAQSLKTVSDRAVDFFIRKKG